MKLVRADELFEKMKKFGFNSKIISIESFVIDELSAANNDKYVKNVTVWWKAGEGRWTEFKNVSGVEFVSENPEIMVIIKKNDDMVYVNMNEVLYVEEETK